ncbi:unnamed protein product, partial [Discosporangium mesarthrocarpum]
MSWPEHSLSASSPRRSATVQELLTRLGLLVPPSEEEQPQPHPNLSDLETPESGGDCQRMTNVNGGTPRPAGEGRGGSWSSGSGSGQLTTTGESFRSPQPAPAQGGVGPGERAGAG